jgi:hypothetical protein
MASAHGLELTTVRPLKQKLATVQLGLHSPCPARRGYLWIQFMPVLLAVGIVAEGVFLFRSID